MAIQSMQRYIADYAASQTGLNWTTGLSCQYHTVVSVVWQEEVTDGAAIYSPFKGVVCLNRSALTAS